MIECALRAVGITCSGGDTWPSLPMALTLTRLAPYEAPSRKCPVLSTLMYGKLSASGPVDDFFRAPVLWSITNVTAVNGFDRTAANRYRLSGLMLIGITGLPPASNFSPGVKA